MAIEFLVEESDLDSMVIEILEESDSKPKQYKIKGPYIECNTQNKNHRVYPSGMMEPIVEAYQKVINSGRAVGELEHPNSLEINMKNISHKTTKLAWEGNNIVMGESNVCATKNGMVVRALMDEGIKLAVSSRGAGTLKEGIVQKDYKYICNDIVWDPSAPSAFVDGILEAKTEWIIQNGILLEKEVEDLITVLKSFPREERNTAILEMFEKNFGKISKFNK